MNIFVGPGDSVRCIKKDKNGILAKFCRYTIKCVRVYANNTDVELKEVDGTFNSCLFEDVVIDEERMKKWEKACASYDKRLRFPYSTNSEHYEKAVEKTKENKKG